VKTYIISFLVSALIGLPITLYGVSTQDKAYKMPVAYETIQGTPVETTASVEDARTGEVVEVELYDVPLDEELQLYIIELCEEHHIAPAFVFAVIEQESGFNADAIGDDGKSMGLMQIYQKYHQDRMEKLGCGDLMNPYQNVAVGIDYLYELFQMNPDVYWVLMAYNGGIAYSNERMATGNYSDYAVNVAARAKELERVVY
jgi:soluble lytic murein transglycosylase-like protein